MNGMPTARIPPDAVRVEAGFYKTPENVLFIDAKELLLANGYEATIANQHWIGRLVQELGADAGTPVLLRAIEKGPPR